MESHEDELRRGEPDTADRLTEEGVSCLSQAEEVSPMTGVESQIAASDLPEDGNGHPMDVVESKGPGSDSEKIGEETPTTAVKSAVQCQKLVSNSSKVGEEVCAMEVVESQKASADSPEKDKGDPMVGLELKVLPLCSQNNKGDEPMAGVESKDLSSDLDDSNPKIGVESEIVNEMSVDADLAVQLAAFDIRRSSRNADKKEQSKKVVPLPRSSYVKKKPALKKSGIIVVVSGLKFSYHT